MTPNQRKGKLFLLGDDLRPVRHGYVGEVPITADNRIGPAFSLEVPAGVDATVRGWGIQSPEGALVINLFDHPVRLRGGHGVDVTVTGRIAWEEA